MNNLFIAENLKVINKVLPIFKIQIHHKDISIIVKKSDLIKYSFLFEESYKIPI
jgi:hypothetical protein